VTAVGRGRIPGRVERRQGTGSITDFVVRSSRWLAGLDSRSPDAVDVRRRRGELRRPRASGSSGRYASRWCVSVVG
jgi:hypothetical protein